MTAELAELVGYFMGDGSLHAKGLRFCVAAGDEDVLNHLSDSIRSLFGIQPIATPKSCTQVLDIALGAFATGSGRSQSNRASQAMQL